MSIEKPSKTICEICGGSHATSNHPEKNEPGETIEVEKEDTLRNEYKDLMNVYQRLYRDIIRLERKHPPERRDRAIQWEIMEIDKERNQTHRKLVSIAEQLGKTKEDVIVDMVRWQESLEEFGLPEFSVLDSADMIETYGATYFNIAFQLDRPQFYEKRETALGEQFWKESEDDLEDAEEHSKPVIADDEILIVFSINTILPKFGYPRTWGVQEEKRPFDYDERIARAKKLAEKTNGKFFLEGQGSHHEADATVMGVVVPKKDLEKDEKENKDGKHCRSKKKDEGFETRGAEKKPRDRIAGFEVERFFPEVLEKRGLIRHDAPRAGHRRR